MNTKIFQIGSPHNKTSLIKAMKYRGISLNYGIGNNPVSISCINNNTVLKKELLDACKEITFKEWNITN